ncbi:hypothetical protein RND81_03G044500 [Saponaria officinalis]|uniref:F-box domain-containing protein n=1 Tax=Saponaria officinalis TaxID=3572 RepID=A0AAW1M374_SAPOF
MAADWSLLPFDIVASIALTLETFEDFIRFSAVCRTWNRASSLIKHQWRATPSVPWLLLAENTNENPNCVRKLFNISNDKFYQLSLPQTFGKRCWGSAYGWIAMVDHDLNHFLWFMHCFLSKLIVIKVSQGDRHEFVIMVLYHYNKCLAFAMHGDQTWTSLIVKENRKVIDAVVTAHYVFSLHDDGSIVHWNVKEFYSREIVEPISYHPPADPEIFEELDERARSIYLVQSGCDLLMVLRFTTNSLRSDDEIDLDEYGLDDSDDFTYHTFGFKVFKLDHKHKIWEQIKDLDNVALFVGENYSISISLTLANCLESNCIYFTDDEAEYWVWNPKVAGQDMGIFDNKCGQIWQIYDVDDISSSIYPPIWFIPQF